jgi:hypothetical protein
MVSAAASNDYCDLTERLSATACANPTVSHDKRSRDRQPVLNLTGPTVRRGRETGPRVETGVADHGDALIVCDPDRTQRLRATT